MNSKLLWEKFKLKDVTIKIGSGATPRGGQGSYVSEGISLVRSQNVYNHYFSYDGLAFITEMQANKLNNVIVKEDDVLLNITGDSVCRCCLVPNSILPARVNQHVAIIRSNEKYLIPFFLKSYLTSPNMQTYMLSLARHGGTRAALTKGIIEDLEIQLPSLKEQERISQLLSRLEKKIELNNQLNQTLEEMAQAIFKHWFVDFEFPNENGEPYKPSGGKFVESELGMIPEGWEIASLSDIGTLLMGLSPKSSTYNEDGEGTALLNGAADFKGKLITPTKYTTDPKRICNLGDLIFCVRATIGNLVYADKQYSIGRGIASITPKKVCYSEFIYYSLNKEMNQLISNATGSVFLNLKKSDINNMKIALPSKEIIEKAHNILNQLQSKINFNEKQNQTLINLRDTLLPKLMSGEIRIPDAEQEVEACLQKTN